MRALVFFLLFVAMPSFAMAPVHTGIAKIRTGPELSDIALFVMACVGVWLARRALRARFARRDAAREE